MYPLIRMFHHIRKANRQPKLSGLFETHVSQHICWPWDIDPWLELNNGRTLTLYDLGRVGLFVRTPITDLMRKQRWGAAVAGLSVRYRRRVRAFDRFEMRTRFIGWDARFNYVEQSMWRRGDCLSHALLRIAVTDSDGIVSSDRVAQALGIPANSPPLPDWAQAWIEAEGLRPWPPQS